VPRKRPENETFCTACRTDVGVTLGHNTSSGRPRQWRASRHVEGYRPGAPICRGSGWAVDAAAVFPTREAESA
jgi:hypothetical protein